MSKRIHFMMRALPLAIAIALPQWSVADQTFSGGGSGGNVIVAQSARVGTSVSLGGTVVPYREVTLSAQVPGRIDFLSGEEGDRFEEGALLVKVNDDELRANRSAAEAELQAAYAAMRNADIQYNRELYAPDSISKAPGGMGLPSMFDQFFTKPLSNMTGNSKPYLERHADLVNQGTQIDQARTSILRAQSQIQAIDTKIRDSRAVAPFDGVIAKKMVEVGDSVQPGQPLVKFADLQYLQVEVDVPARLMPGLRKGMIVPAKLDVGDRQVKVRVAQIFPIADSQRHTVTVKLDLPTGAPAAPGMYANVMIPDVNAPARDTVVIPNSAVQWQGSLPAVKVLNSKGEPELRLVRVGEQVDRDHITILSGLQPNERIVDRPQGTSSSTSGSSAWTTPSNPAPSYGASPLGGGNPSGGGNNNSGLPPYSTNPSYGGGGYDPGYDQGGGSYGNSPQYYVPR